MNDPLLDLLEKVKKYMQQPTALADEQPEPRTHQDLQEANRIMRIRGQYMEFCEATKEHTVFISDAYRA